MFAGLCLLSLACGGRTSGVSTEDGSGTGESGTGTGDAGEAGEGTAESGEVGESGSGDETGGGMACGEQRCGPEEWCNFAHDGCGEQEGERAECVRRPETCEGPGDPVCGCDGMMYGSECEAQSAGVDLSVAGGCPAVEGAFECGYTWCESGAEYCRRDVDDTGMADFWHCLPLPGGCPIPATCDCLAGEPCADFSCEPLGDGLFVICPGG
jgi:hypothetical protein